MDDLKELTCPGEFGQIIADSNENAGRIRSAIESLEEDKADRSFVSPPGIIPHPEGGHYRTSTWSLDGTAKIRLPVSWSDTMLTFSVNIFEYRENRSKQIMIAGFLAKELSAWAGCTVAKIAGDRPLRVRLGHDGERCAVYLAADDYNWRYPEIDVYNLFPAYQNAGNETWDKGWEISIVPPDGVISYDATV